MRNTHALELAFLPLLILCTAVGCGTPTSNAMTGAESVRQADHLEHHVPEHRPASFAAAVEQIASRHERLRNEIGKATREPVDRQLRELLDILDWLPEIAGDSDLRQADWNLVQQQAHQLADCYQKLDPEVLGGQPGHCSFDELKARIEDLRVLVPVSDRQR